MENTHKPLSFWNRFIAIWRPDFLQRHLAHNDSRGAWRFWFGAHLFLTFLFSIFFTLVYSHFVENLQDPNGNFQSEIFSVIPQDFVVTLDNDGLSTKNFPDPYLWNNANHQDFVFVLDTKGDTYTVETLSSYSSGVFIDSEKIVSKENDFKSETFLFSRFMDSQNQELVFDYNALQNIFLFLKSFTVSFFFLVFFFGYFFLAVFRLLLALWWALFSWVIGRHVLNIHSFSFKKAYESVLHLYLIPLILEFVLLINGFSIPFSTLFIFTLFFGMNFYALKQSLPPETITTKELQ